VILDADQIANLREHEAVDLVIIIPAIGW